MLFHVKRTLTFAIEIPYLGIFRLDFGKSYCHVLNQHPRIFQRADFQTKTNKTSNSGPKCFILVFVDKNLSKTVVIF